MHLDTHYTRFSNVRMRDLYLLFIFTPWAGMKSTFFKSQDLTHSPYTRPKTKQSQQHSLEEYEPLLQLNWKEFYQLNPHQNLNLPTSIGIFQTERVIPATYQQSRKVSLFLYLRTKNYTTILLSPSREYFRIGKSPQFSSYCHLSLMSTLITS